MALPKTCGTMRSMLYLALVKCAMPVKRNMAARAQRTAKAKYSMARMVPQVFGNAMAWVYFTGLCEIAGAVGLLLPRFRSLAGICLILLLIAMFPANAKAAIEHLKVAGRPATPLWLRLPLQLVFIALAWWVSRL